MQRLLSGSRSTRRWPNRQPLAALLAPLALLAGVLWSVIAPSAAHASDGRFDELNHQADAAMRGKRPREAIGIWRAAWSLKQSHMVACNIGKGELRYGNAREAAEFLSICLRISPTPVKPDETKRHAQFTAHLEQARSQVAALNIEVDQSGATVQIDERRLGLSPLQSEIFVEPGEHTISVTLEGFERFEVEISMKRGEARTVPILLTRTTAKAAPRAEATTAPPLLPLAPLAPLARRLPAPAPPRSPSKVVIASGASFATAGLGLGAGLLIASGELKGDAITSRQNIRLRLLDHCAGGNPDGSCSSYLSAEQSRATMRNVATASFIGAGLGAAATIVYALFPRSPIAPSILGKGEGMKVSF